MEYMTSVFDAFLDGKIAHIQIQPGGHYLDQARNQCVDTFLEGDDEWLLFVDDDQKFKPSDIDTLFAKATDEHRVICGWYLSTMHGGGLQPVVFGWGPHEKYGEHFVTVTTTQIKEAPRDDQGYITVEAAGTGFMAIHRSMILEIRERWPLPTSPFAELVIEGVHCGEDLTFCARVRRLGYNVYVHPDVHVGHVKTLLLIEEQ